MADTSFHPSTLQMFPSANDADELELSSMLSEIFPESATSMDKVSLAMTKTAGIDASIKPEIPLSSSPSPASGTEASDYFVVSDDESTQNPSSQGLQSIDREPENVAPPMEVLSGQVIGTSSEASISSKKRSFSEIDEEVPPFGETKQKVQRRERNREHAKKSRSRKKNLTKQLEVSLVILREENKKLKQFVHTKFSEKQTKEMVKKRIVTPNDRLVAALQDPSHRTLTNSAISYLQSLASDFKR